MADTKARGRWRRGGIWGMLTLGLVLAGIGLTSARTTGHASAAPTCGASVSGPPVVGRCAATFTLRDVRGHAVDLAHDRGHPVLLNFWGVGCTECAAELPALKGFARAFTRQNGVILGVNTWGEPATLIAGYAHRSGIAWPLLPDQPGAVGSLYGVRGTPTNVFVDRHGVIRAITIGPLTQAQFAQNARRL